MYIIQFAGGIFGGGYRDLVMEYNITGDSFTAIGHTELRSGRSISAVNSADFSQWCQ